MRYYFPSFELKKLATPPEVTVKCTPLQLGYRKQKKLIMSLMKDEWFLYKSEVCEATGLMLYLGTNCKAYSVTPVISAS